MVVSVSKINAFNTCHYRYKLQYIDKVQSEIPKCFSRGSQIHKALEHPENTDVPEAVQFLQSPLGLKYKEIIFGASTKEHKIGLKIENGNVVPCKFSDKECFFHGIIDVLANGFILDYKTGKAKQFKDQDWTQLMYYSVWYFLTYPERNEVKLSYLYIEHNTENCITIHRNFLSQIMSKLMTKVLEIKQYEECPNNDHCMNPLCDYCIVREQCKFFTEGLENIEFQTVDLDALMV